MRGVYCSYLLIAGLCWIGLAYKAGLALWPVDGTLATVAAGCTLWLGCKVVVRAVEGFTT